MLKHITVRSLPSTGIANRIQSPHTSKDLHQLIVHVHVKALMHDCHQAFICRDVGLGGGAEHVTTDFALQELTGFRVQMPAHLSDIVTPAVIPVLVVVAVAPSIITAAQSVTHNVGDKVALLQLAPIIVVPIVCKAPVLIRQHPYI